MWTRRTGQISRLWLLSAVLVLCLALVGCGGKTSLQDAPEMSGVFVCPKCDNAAVTFALPKDKTIEEVVGSAVAEDHVTHVDEEGQEPFDVHWSPVEGGGFVSWVGDVYRFAPEAEGEEPPGYVMIYDPVDELELLDPAEVDALKQYYNITLNLS